MLIEDKASGTQLIQELIADGCHGVIRYQPDCDKIMRLHAQTAMIACDKNGVLACTGTLTIIAVFAEKVWG